MCIKRGGGVALWRGKKNFGKGKKGLNIKKALVSYKTVAKARGKKKHGVMIGEMKRVIEGVVEYVKVHEDCYCVTDFAVEIGFDPIKMIDDWTGKSARYDRELAVAKEIIKNRIIKNGLQKKIDSPFGKFVLQVNHGMNEPATRVLVSADYSKKLEDIVGS